MYCFAIAWHCCSRDQESCETALLTVVEVEEHPAQRRARMRQERRARKEREEKDAAAAADCGSVLDESAIEDVVDIEEVDGECETGDEAQTDGEHVEHDHLDIVAKDVARSQWKLDDARDSYTVPRHLCDLAGIISAPPRPSARPLQ